MSTFHSADELATLCDALSMSPDAILAIDERRRIVFWNKAAQSMLGFTSDEVTGRACSTVLAGADHFGNRYCSDTCPVISIVQRGEELHPFQLRIRAKDGQQVPVDVSAIKFILSPSRRIVLAYTIRRAQIGQPDHTPRQQEPVKDARVAALTARELEILGLLAAGEDSADISVRLGISRVTARNHIQHLFQKLEVHSKAEAVAFAYKTNVVHVN
jgi:PAS domain S-box-containing protein